MIAIIFLLIGNWPFELISVPFAQIMLWIAVIMTVYSGAEYIYKSRETFPVEIDFRYGFCFYIVEVIGY